MWPSRSARTSARRSRFLARGRSPSARRRECELHQDLDDGAVPAARFRCRQQPLEQPCRLGCARCCVPGTVLGQQHHGHGDVLELAQVGELSSAVEVVSVRPVVAGGEISVRELDSRSQGGNGAHVRGEVPEVHLFGLRRGARTPAGRSPWARAQPSLGDAPAVGVLRQTGGVAELPAHRQVVGRRCQVVALASDLAEPDVHVGGAPRHRRWVVVGEAQRVLVVPHGVGEPALGDPDVGERDRAAQDVGDVPGESQPFDARRVGTVRPLQVAPGPLREPGRGGGAGSGQVVVVGGARAMASSAWVMVAAGSPSRSDSAER